MFTLFSLLILSTSFLPLAKPQFIASLPRCIQNCIDQSGDGNCSVTDIKCLCRASAGNFLPELITCMYGNCDNNLDKNLLLTPLQLACEIAGVPIPDSAIQSAEGAGSSLGSQITKTVTMGASSATGSGFEATTTAESSYVSTVTVTTTEGGSIIAIVYPVTEWRTTTASGSRSTITSSAPSGNSDSSGESTTIVTTSLAAAQTSSQSTSKTEKAPSPDETDSAPFTDTNSAAVKEGVSNWLGMTVLIGMGILLF